MTTDETPPRQRWPVWPWLVLTIAGVLVTATAAVVGTAAGSDPAGDRTDDAPVTMTYLQFETTTVTETVTVAPPPPAGPIADLNAGLHRVGIDVQPGRYQTGGPDGSNPSGCYWTRTAPDGDLIDNGRLSGQGTIEINEGELVETAGCQTWHKIV